MFLPFFCELGDQHENNQLHTTEPTLQLTGLHVDNTSIKFHNGDRASTPTQRTDPEIDGSSNNNNHFINNNNEKSNNINNNTSDINNDRANHDECNDVNYLNQQVHKANTNRKRNKKYGGCATGKSSKSAKSGRSIFSLHRRQSSAAGGGVWQTTLDTAAAMTGVGPAQTMNSNKIGDNPAKIISDNDGDPSGANAASNKLLPGGGGGGGGDSGLVGGLGGNGAPPSTAATAVATVPATGTKRPVRRGGKAQPDRPVRVLFCLGLKNPLRKLCIDIVEWKYPFLETPKNPKSRALRTRTTQSNAIPSFAIE